MVSNTKCLDSHSSTDEKDTSLTEISIPLGFFFFFFFFAGLKSLSTKRSVYLHFTATHIPISCNKGQQYPW